MENWFTPDFISTGGAYTDSPEIRPAEYWYRNGLASASRGWSCDLQGHARRQVPSRRRRGQSGRQRDREAETIASAWLVDCVFSPTWDQGCHYAAGDVVSIGRHTYQCTVEHVATVHNLDSNWVSTLAGALRPGQIGVLPPDMRPTQDTAGYEITIGQDTQMLPYREINDGANLTEWTAEVQRSHTGDGDPSSA
jgi:hypothetical protein